ncbi:12987_t:CDS:2, partial [Cetraspora pellucida]
TPPVNRNPSVKRHSQATNLFDSYISCLIHLNKDILVEKSIVSQSITPPIIPRKRPPIKLDTTTTHLVTSEDCILVLNFFFRENLFDLTEPNHNDEYCWMGMFMYKFFLEHSSSIDKLSIGARSGSSILSLSNQNFHLNRKYINVDDCLIIPPCLNSSNCLPKLTKLVCTTRYRKANFLSSIAKICHYIKTLIVRVDCDMTYSLSFPLIPISRNSRIVEHESVSELIKSQRGLVHLEIISCSIGLGNIMSALKSQVATLRSLHFTNIDLSYILNHLTSLTNLITLQFYNCYSTRIDLPLDQVINLSKLETLHFDEDNDDSSFPLKSIPVKIVETLIDACSFNLSWLHLGKLSYPMDLDGVINQNSIRFMAPRFYNLTYFKINIECKEQIPQVIDLVKNCSYLETIILCQAGYFEKSLSVFETNYMLETLRKNGLPTTLKSFALHGKWWMFTCVSLEIFLGLNINSFEPNFYHDKNPVFELDLTGASQCFTNQHLNAILKANTYRLIVKKVLLSSCILPEMLSPEMITKAGDLIKIVKLESDKIGCIH